MKKWFLLTVRNVYLIRRLDSLFGGATYVICALLIGPFELFDASHRSFLLLFPISYLALELLLLYLYRELQTINKGSQLDYFKINRYQSIIINFPNEQEVCVGNLVGFWSFTKVYRNCKTLMDSKILGLIVSICGIFIIYMEAKGVALVLLVLIFILLAIKSVSEGIIQESSNN